PCGIMDQFISVNGQVGHALMLDCRSLEFQQVPIPPGIAVVACNTMTHHAIAGGEYNIRRQQCELAARFFGVRALRDVSMAEFKRRESQLPGVECRRARHVISENARVADFAKALSEDDRPLLGRLMADSHRSLRDDFEVSCPELDVMVEVANQAEGLIGARMTGGGFGGCTVNLVREDAVEAFRDFVARRYEEQSGMRPEIYVSRPAEGAAEID
ncbi:MAG: galactokinase, partial [Terriglobales bacterium]